MNTQSGSRFWMTEGKSSGHGQLASGCGVSVLFCVTALPGFLGWCSGYKFNHRFVRQVLLHLVTLRDQVMVIRHDCRVGKVMSNIF